MKQIFDSKKYTQNEFAFIYPSKTPEKNKKIQMLSILKAGIKWFRMYKIIINKLVITFTIIIVE